MDYFLYHSRVLVQHPLTSPLPFLRKPGAVTFFLERAVPVFHEKPISCIFLAFFFFFLVFLGPHPWHMEVPGLGVESEL